ncbi:DNA cytosine methyltransferase [Mucilaginibacter gilvus]|uniref:DNA (cytosine-5-)-methyltransferase n=1 Tax=Mucilaginibacter gilvus TaxID=2305909 RepID=A0A3S3WZY9_9SPHI|nr:DNA cytosine methyltransferase [Mucilaginibacter gilvus]RWY47478.1 DNA (cytosine-5-)-methyltransferase [Mucilaginibacter gilvus]
MKSIELFAGAGGLGIGLHLAGFKPVQVVEWDRFCCDTIRENKNRNINAVKSWPLIEGDIKSVDFKNFAGKIDLVSGGPPCQPFSLGGKHQAYDDSRDMFPQAIRTVRETQPKAFIFENVKGLTRNTFRNYFEYIKLQLEHPNLVCNINEDWTDHLKRLEKHHTSGIRTDLHYNVVTRLVNAANYGVPQKRERVFFVGFRDDLGVEWSFPEETHSQDALIWSQINDGIYWDRHNVTKDSRVINLRSKQRAVKLEQKPTTLPWLTIRDAIRGLPDPEKNADKNNGFSDHRFQPGAKTYPGHTGSPLDEPAKTLKAGVHGVPGGENMVAFPDGSVRYFTVRESARLQTFPDNYLFHGSWGETMRQLGNAVPVELANVVGLNVANILKATA